MLDPVERLLACVELLRLLDHYAELGNANREVWQDRLMAMDGVEPKQLSRLHGELIAFGWIEQNTGQTSPAAHGGVGRCYRVTLAGLRASRQAGHEQPTEEAGQPEPLAEPNSETLSVASLR